MIRQGTVVSNLQLMFWMLIAIDIFGAVLSAVSFGLALKP